ncbi:MAG: hypothetical protein NTV98_06070 [Candidatus Roizmanbacteria bacterium]|nr:hypothetical protein [Candidatus Roizmanbacteria bacterium]
MNLSLEQIERQLQELRNNKAPVNLPYMPNTQVLPTEIVEQPVLSVEELKNLIREVVVQEISLVKDSLIPIQQEITVGKETNPKLTMLEAIGLSLTPEEQTWLFHIDKLQHIQDHLPIFFQTEDGKLAIQSFLIYYQGQFNANTSD